MQTVAILFARADSIYKTMSGRDANDWREAAAYADRIDRVNTPANLDLCLIS